MIDSEERVTIQSEQDIVAARQRAREIARSLGFGMVDQSRVATAVSEVTRNVVRYATNSRGETYIRTLSGDRRGIEIVVADEGPGIDDIDQALREGFTSGAGMGMGLPGSKRLMDELTIDSVLGRGTVITMRKWCRA
jgi:serine/threonine-protein kinase RsbT